MKFEKLTAIVLAALLIAASCVLAAISLLQGSPDDAPASAMEPGAKTLYSTEPSPTAETEPPPTPTPTITPSATPDDIPEITPHSASTMSAEVRDILESMTLREKICQLFIVYPTRVSSLADYPVGGLVYSLPHLGGGSEAVLAEIEARQSQSRIPLIICADEEGGDINRLMAMLGTTYFDNMFDYRDDGAETAFSNAATIAADMLACGFNTNLAPVADVWSNPDNQIVGERAYSDDFSEAAELVASAVEGFVSRGLICTLKHFPGHGDTLEDSHYMTAIVTKTYGELLGEELLPFISGIEAGADMVMIGHLTVPSISDKPATVSHEIVTGILRGDLGYDGVVISDGLEMAAVKQYYGTGELCVAAIQAGIDILLGPGSLETGVAALEAAVINGEITHERIDESVERILEMKLAHGLL